MIHRIMLAFLWRVRDAVSGVYKKNSIADHPTSVLQCFELLPMDGLLFQGPGLSPHRALLLRAMRRDELLFELIASQ
jgi:hypothetical protein